jgi:diguanylate cyclase (GGDEF)-like protein
LFILDQSEKDKLTGLYNRRTFDKKLTQLILSQTDSQVRLFDQANFCGNRSLKANSSTWLAMIDIDNFKSINDNHGHIFGDAVLLMLSHKMKSSFRQNDYLFRFGGDELIVMLEPQPIADAHIALDRFRQAIADHVFPLVGSITVSIGFAEITFTDHPPSILDSADRALYYAKHAGKNCVFNYEDLIADHLIDKTCIGSTLAPAS